MTSQRPGRRISLRDALIAIAVTAGLLGGTIAAVQISEQRSQEQTVSDLMGR